VIRKAEFKIPAPGLHVDTLATEENSMSTKIAIAAAVLATLAGPALANNVGHSHGARIARPTQAVAVPPGAFAAEFGNARAAVGGGSSFESFPTDYLTNRFGDRQLQGR
jgi:hypothetical protein